MEMHSAGKPVVKTKRCTGCGLCMRVCAHDAITFDENRKAFIDVERCVGCGRCIGVCNFDAVRAPFDESFDILNAKIAEYTAAVLNGRPHFHVSLVADVSPNCDCHSENDLPIIPDVGMFASFDPVALDVACVEAANRQPIVPGSLLDRRKRCEDDHFISLHPETDWRSTIDHAVRIGLGSREYELITIR